MRIAILGSGGVGGYFGGRLAASGQDVTFIARGAHLAALQRDGLRLASVKGDLHLPQVRAVESPSDVGPVDVVFFTVKMYDAEKAAASLAPLIGNDTVVIPFQNGVEAIDILAPIVGAAHVAGGIAYITAVVAAPGVIRHTSLDTLIFGELDGRPSPRLAQLAAAGQAAGFVAKLSSDIHADLWSKFIRLTVFSGMTSATRSPLGVLRSHPALQQMMESAWHEGIAVARARHVRLPDGLVDEIRQMIATMPAEAKSSMLEDLERGHRLELPWLSGAVVRLGEAAGVPTPTHRFLTAILSPHVNGH